jgi:hypothetical protein
MVEELSIGSNKRGVVQYLHEYDCKAENEVSALNSLWEEEHYYNSSSLPSYYDLCIMERDELHQRLVEPFATIFAMFGVGHFITKVGLYHWYVVLRCYKIFVLVCLGVWTDEAVEAYDLKKIVREVLYASDVLENKDQLLFRAKYEMEEEVPTLLSVLVNSRAMLFQIVPFLTPLTALCMGMSPFPIFIRSSFLRSCLPSILIYGEENRNVSIEKELFFLGLTSDNEDEQKTKLGELLENYRWRIIVRGFVIFWNNSRILRLLNALVILLLSLLIIFYEPKYLKIIVILLGLLLPFVFSSAVVVFLYLGKSLDMVDKDFGILSRLFQISNNQTECHNVAEKEKIIESYLEYSKNKILRLKNVLSIGEEEEQEDDDSRFSTGDGDELQNLDELRDGLDDQEEKSIAEQNI